MSTMKKQCFLFAAAALTATLSRAEVTHMSESKGMRIPSGSFTQFRLVGDGLNDDNLQADVMQVEHEIKIVGQKTEASYGLFTSDTFDVFVFDDETDYNCYIEKSRLWAEHRRAEKCDFVDNKPFVMFEKVTEWNSADPIFLSKDKAHNDILIVIDNTGYLPAVKLFDNAKPAYQDVTYEMSIKTVFAANDLYNKTFLAFMVTLGILFALILTMCCIYRMQKKSHSQVLQTKKELKRITLQKMYKDLNQGGADEVDDDQKPSMFMSESKLQDDDDDEDDDDE